MPGIYWLAAGGVALTLGDIAFKYWIEHALPYVSTWYAGGLLLYIGGLVCLIESFRTENIAVASAVFVIVNIATLAFVSWIYFDERLSLLQGTGLLLALVAIFCMELAK